MDIENGIELQEFDMDDLPDYPSIVLNGKRRAGKGIMTKFLCFHYFKKRIKTAFLFSPTCEIANNQMDFIPTHYRYKEFDPDVVDRIMKRQEYLIRNDPKGNHHTLLVVDDIISTLDAKSQKCLDKIFIAGRHFQISLIVCFQYVKREFSTIQRTNCDMIFCFQQNNFNNKESLVLEYLNTSDNKKDGFALFNKYAEGYNCLVINNTGTSNNYEDYCYTFQADIIKKKFILGNDY